MRVAAYVTPKQFRANSLYCIYVAIKCIIVLHFKKKTSPFLFFFFIKIDITKYIDGISWSRFSISHLSRLHDQNINIIC